jgi:D-hexose-6-phosphate mutarotase
MSTVIHRLPAANHIAKNSTQKTYGTSYYFNSMNPKHSNANVSWVGTTPTYHTYPEIEHITHTHTEVIKESVVGKEVDSRPSEVTSQSATVDITRLADQVYSSIERKLMIEKERRGLYG